MRLVLLVARRELALALRRPLFWFYLALCALVHSLYYYGEVEFGEGVASGGLGEDDRVHLNGPYLLTLFHLSMVFVVSTLFASLATASASLRDAELRVEGVLRGTHLSARQYVLGKLLGIGLWTVGVTLLGVALGYLNDTITAGGAQGGGAGDPRLFGESDLRYHLVPLAIALPWLLFVVALSFWASLRTRSVMFSFLLVMGFFVVVMFLSDFGPEKVQRWSEERLGQEWEVVRGWIDPSGVSWLLAHDGAEDRGVAYYNTTIPVPDLGFAIQRGLLLVLSGVLLLRALRAETRPRHGPREAADQAPSGARERPPGPPRLLAPPGHRSPLGWLGVLRLELRLLVRQIGVWVAGVMGAIFATSSALVARTGAWDAPILPTSSTAALGIVQGSTLWLCGLAAFLAIEVLNRERVTRFGDIFFASPVRSASVLWGKLAAITLTVLVILAATTLLTIVLQPALHSTRPDVAIYLRFVGVLLVPGLLFFVAAGSLCAVLFRDRLSAYGGMVLFVVPYVVALSVGWLDWRGVLIPSASIAASDITGLGPYRDELLYNRVGVLATTFGLLLLTARAFRRTDRPLSRCFSAAALRRHRPASLAFAMVLIVVGWCQVELGQLIDRGPNGAWREDRREDYARLNRPKWGRLDGTPEFLELDLRVDLHPDERRFELDGVFTFVNRTDRGFRVIPLTVGEDWDVEPEGWVFELTDEGEREAELRDRKGLYEVRLHEELAPGEQCRLRLRYGGTVEGGARQHGGAFSHWILPEAVFLDSFGPNFLPVPGYVELENLNEDLFDDEATPEEMAARYAGRLRAAFGGTGAFDVRVAISVPRDMTALSAGVLRDREERGDRRVFHYHTDHPVYFFPIMAGRYELVERGDCKVYHSRLHPQNVEQIADALDRSRRFYSKVFSPYPYGELRIVEFPGLADFAMGHPTLIPFSESIGFLTKDEPGTSNVNFMVTAHEVAHQWWGNMVTPAQAPGMAFLTEALAHYSTLLMEERFNGRVECRNRRAKWERLYVEARRIDVERPIVRIDGSEPGDTATWYNKGGWVFWMLSEHMGREALLRALRAFLEEYSFEEHHPTIHDLLRHVRAEGGDAIEPFLDQWFYRAVLPAPRIVSALVSGDEEAGYTTRIILRNEKGGRARLCVEVANRRLSSVELGAMPRPQRIEADDLPDDLGWKLEEEQRTDADDPYRSARGTVQLPAEGEVELRIASAFRPRWVVIDPDVQLLMSGRTRARLKLD